MEKTKLPQKIKFNVDDLKKLKITEILKKILANPNICDKEWIWHNMITLLWEIQFKSQEGDSGGCKSPWNK